jgi:hypothetical protein
MWLARFKDTSKTGKLKGMKEETSHLSVPLSVEGTARLEKIKTTM